MNTSSYTYQDNFPVKPKVTEQAPLTAAQELGLEDDKFGVKHSSGTYESGGWIVAGLYKKGDVDMAIIHPENQEPSDFSYKLVTVDDLKSWQDGYGVEADNTESRQPDKVAFQRSLGHLSSLRSNTLPIQLSDYRNKKD